MELGELARDLPLQVARGVAVARLGGDVHEVIVLRGLRVEAERGGRHHKHAVGALLRRHGLAACGGRGEVGHDARTHARHLHMNR